MRLSANDIGNPAYERNTERNLHFKSERTVCPMYDKEGDLIGNVPVTFSYANTQGYEYEITDVVYGDLLNVKPEFTDIVMSIQEKMGATNSLSIVGNFTHEPALV
jgi:hypothetical protein